MDIDVLRLPERFGETEGNGEEIVHLYSSPKQSALQGRP